jgi:hypothetical protein
LRRLPAPFRRIFQSPWYDDAGIVFFIIRSVSPVFGIGVSSITNTASLPPTKDTGLDEKTSSLAALHPYQRRNGAPESRDDVARRSDMISARVRCFARGLFDSISQR